jgi:hypothetical protein
MAMLAGVVLWTGTAQAQVTGSFDGAVTGPRVTTPLNASAAFLQMGPFVTGTLALASVPPDFAGIYTLTGKANTKKLKVSGVSATGALLKWKAKITPGLLQGNAKIKKPGGKLKGSLALTMNAATSDGSSCDNVYTGNSTFFADQVVAQVLDECTECHVPGGQASTTRFQITAGDPLATARSMAPHIDAANPDASRILLKPMDVLPHGGGVQITAGSPEEAILRQWVELVAAASCI